MSSDSSVRGTLEGYIAGRLPAEQLVGVVAAAYYREQGPRSKDTPGFAVRIAERPFPKRNEPELRQAVQSVLQTLPVSRGPFPEQPNPKPTLLKRIIAAIRKVFSA